MKKITSLLIVLFFSLIINATEDKTVILTVSAQGSTLSESKQNALRNAIEQTFGTFISSKTEILNDELVNDELVSVSNGNIKKFEIISEVKISEGKYSTTLIATVSVSKLTSFVESKGVNAEFKGSLFSLNIKQQQLNEKNESTVIDNMLFVVGELIYKSFNYEIIVGNPTSTNDNKWDFPMTVMVTTNDNIISALNYLENTLIGISLSKSDIKNYKSLNKPTWPIKLSSKTIHLRNRSNAGNILGNMLMNLYNASYNFIIEAEGTNFVRNFRKDRSKTRDRGFINSPRMKYSNCPGCTGNPQNNSIHESVDHARSNYLDVYNYTHHYPTFFSFVGAPGLKLKSISKINSKLAKIEFSLKFTLPELEKISKFTIISNENKS